MIDIKRIMEAEKDKASVWQDSERFRMILALALLDEARALDRTSGEKVQIYRLADSLLDRTV